MSLLNPIRYSDVQKEEKKTRQAEGTEDGKMLGSSMAGTE